MTLEDNYRARIREALGTDPMMMQLNVFGSESVTEDTVSDTRFLNMIAKVLPAFAETLEELCQEVDALKARL